MSVSRMVRATGYKHKDPLFYDRSYCIKTRTESDLCVFSVRKMIDGENLRQTACQFLLNTPGSILRQAVVGLKNSAVDI